MTPALDPEILSQGIRTSAQAPKLQKDLAGVWAVHHCIGTVCTHTAAPSAWHGPGVQ